MTPLNFSVSVETDDATGAILSVYLQVRKGKSREVREFADGAAIADYNRNGELLGVELLAPCSITVVDQLAANEPARIRQQAKRWIRQVAPRAMVAI